MTRPTPTLGPDALRLVLALVAHRTMARGVDGRWRSAHGPADESHSGTAADTLVERGLAIRAGDVVSPTRRALNAYGRNLGRHAPARLATYRSPGLYGMPLGSSSANTMRSQACRCASRASNKAQRKMQGRDADEKHW